MSALLQRAVEQLCREVDALRARVAALEPPKPPERTLDEWKALHALRGQAAADILEASETAVDAEVLAKMIAAGNSTPAGQILKWLRTVVERGEGNDDHPLFPYLVDKKPLRFGKKTVASPAATVRQ